MKIAKQKFEAELLYMCKGTKVDQDWTLAEDLDLILLSVGATKGF